MGGGGHGHKGRGYGNRVAPPLVGGIAGTRSAALRGRGKAGGYGICGGLGGNLILAYLLSLARSNRKEFKRFFKFGIVGAIGFVVDFGTFNLLHTLLGLWSVAASVVSFCAAVLSNFAWNRYWIYPDSRSKRISHQLSQFAVVSVVGLLIRTPIFALLEKPYAQMLDSTGIASMLNLRATTLGSNLALVSAVVVVLFWNFLANRLWTYNDV